MQNAIWKSGTGTSARDWISASAHYKTTTRIIAERTKLMKVAACLVNIEVHFFSRLRDLAGASRVELELVAGATVGDALARLYAERPKLQPWDGHLLLAVGLEYVRREHVLRGGDVLSVMPPVQGG